MQCQSLTKMGLRCKIIVRNNKKYCPLHTRNVLQKKVSEIDIEPQISC